MNYQELLRSPIVPPQIAPFIQKAAHYRCPCFDPGGTGNRKGVDRKNHPLCRGLERLSVFINSIAECWSKIPSVSNFRIFLKRANYGTIPATLYLEEIGSLGHDRQLLLWELIEDGMWQDG